MFESVILRSFIYNIKVSSAVWNSLFLCFPFFLFYQIKIIVVIYQNHHLVNKLVEGYVIFLSCNFNYLLHRFLFISFRFCVYYMRKKNWTLYHEFLIFIGLWHLFVRLFYIVSYFKSIFLPYISLQISILFLLHTKLRVSLMVCYAFQ